MIWIYFLKIVTEDLMLSINDYSDNELKYNIFGANSLKTPNYNIIKDINNYLEDYENRYKIK